MFSILSKYSNVTRIKIESKYSKKRSNKFKIDKKKENAKTKRS